MQLHRPKLQKIYEACMSQAEPIGASWCDWVHGEYTPNTLVRMLHASAPETRQSAAWALGWIGEESHLEAIGPLLRDVCLGVRSAADQARQAIVMRTQSPWHRRCAARIETMLAAAQWSQACALANALVEETESRADAFMLRAGVRFCNQQLAWAADDCKRTLAIDPYCYRACIALGQCFWHQQRDAAARECFYEAARIYPDWGPAYASLRLVQRSEKVA
jgi:hypothetical protein